ncbi:hypothetical protein BKA61DRAFT_624487 [Leptodontidium sp. MPI-SDFR-AT-0119]|nr:hypothetical protein BKA61DRAFT_624487 [Leptodontidium sp. MPI-SDFR-AT-0119]
MAETQPPTIVEGATTGDVDDEIPVAAKSAEDRKAAAALSSLDTPRDDESAGKDVDQEAVRKAMERLSGGGAGVGATNGAVAKKGEQKVVKKTVKVDPADVTLLIDELELSKIKATDLLKSHDGNAEAALRAYITLASASA